MAQSTAAYQAQITRLQRVFREERKAFRPFYQTLCTVITSNGFDEEYGMLGSAPGVREWLGDRKFHSLRAANFTIVNKLWEVSTFIPKTAMDDDRVGLYDSNIQQLARRAMSHPDKLVLGDLIPNATQRTCLDGQFFFDTDHSWGDSGSQSNDLTDAVVDKDAPTVSEFNDLLSQMVQAMLAFKDDNGELLHDEAIVDINDGMQLTLVVPLKYLRVAQMATTPGIAINSGETNVPAITARVVASARITGDYFDLYRTDTPVKPFIFQAREPMVMRTKGEDDIEFKDVKFMTRARYNAGYGAWWNAVRMTVTTA